MEVTFTVHTKVRRPIADVFDAVYNPGTLRRYFTTGGASGPLDEGKTVSWEFADHPGAFDIQVKKVVPRKLIVFEWPSDAGGGSTRVEMTFEAVDENTTLVTITETGWPDTSGGRKSSYGNCQGWTQMLCCLKAWVEHGINLREGAY
jgi:uncharacterized protein YndB with AHSA1/START domain